MFLQKLSWLEQMILEKSHKPMAYLKPYEKCLIDFFKKVFVTFLELFYFETFYKSRTLKN